MELVPEGRFRDPFSDYQKFVVSHDELAQIARNPEANQEWQARLSSQPTYAFSVSVSPT